MYTHHDPQQGYFIKRCFMNGELCNKTEKLKIDPKQVFVIMPFKDKDNIFFAIKDAITKSHYRYKRADLEHSNIMIPCKVCQDIQNSQIIVGDVSDYNPNVFFELGIAFAIGRTVKLVKDDSFGTPSDLSGLEYIQYNPIQIDQLSDRLQEWFQQVKIDRYHYDPYLLGHLFKIEKMALVLNNFNAKGDTTTEYEITAQKIGLGESDEDLFAMPYHDSVSVDVSEAYFALKANDFNNNPLDIKHIILSSRLKRFCLVLKNMEFEQKKIFNVKMKEKQLFDQEESHDWYDINIIYPIELLSVSISINPKWKIKKAWASYGESIGKVKSELRELHFDRNSIYAQFQRPKVGLTYMIRWEWDI